MPLDPFDDYLDSKRCWVSCLNFRSSHIRKIRIEKVKMVNKLLFLGAIGAFFMATSATLVSDMHGIGDCFNGSGVDNGIT